VRFLGCHSRDFCRASPLLDLAMEVERALVLMTLCVLSQREVIGIQSSVEYDPGRL